MTEWIKATFDQKNQLYERVFVPSQEETERQTQFVIDFAKLTSSDRVFDVGCGTGRHVLSLATKGIPVDGLDISPISVEEAQKAINLLQLEIPKSELYIADARELPQKHPELAGRYSLAISLFSSFGYYESDDEQLTLLRGIKHILQPKGALLLDLPNKDFILQHFSDESEFTIDDLIVRVTRKYNPNRSRIETKTGVTDGQTEDVMDVAMNLYSYTDIDQLLQQAGFIIEKVARDFTSVDFDPQDSSCKRILILARKI